MLSSGSSGHAFLEVLRVPVVTNILHNHYFTFFSFYVEEERRLDIDEKPLVVQLNWNKDDREGRFVLKNENDALPLKVGATSTRIPCSMQGSLGQCRDL